METLANYIKTNGLENHSSRKNIELLYNTAIEVRKQIVSNDRIEGFEHKNSSVMFLVCASIEKFDVLKNNYKLNTNVFDFNFITERLAVMLEENASIVNTEKHPFDSGIWG